MTEYEACPNCGAPVGVGAAVCSFCGSALDSSPPPGAEPAEPDITAGPGPVAPLWRRAAARLLDLCVVILLAWLGSVLARIVALVGVQPSGTVVDGAALLAGAIFLAGLIGGLFYETVSIVRRGQTVGKRIVGVKVVDIFTGECPEWQAAAVRSLALGTVVVAVWILWDPLSRGLHDKAAHTIVIEARPARPRPAGPGT